MDEFLVAIEKEKLPSEGNRGLMVYFYDDQLLSEKVYSLHPTVEEWNGKLWGVMVAEVYGKLTEAETAKLWGRLSSPPVGQQFLFPPPLSLSSPSPLSTGGSKSSLIYKATLM